MRKLAELAKNSVLKYRSEVSSSISFVFLYCGVSAYVANAVSWFIAFVLFIFLYCLHAYLCNISSKNSRDNAKELMEFIRDSFSKEEAQDILGQEKFKRYLTDMLANELKEAKEAAESGSQGSDFVLNEVKNILDRKKSDE